MQGLTFLHDVAAQTDTLAAQASPPSFFGMTASGGKAYTYYQPSIETFSGQLTDASSRGLDPNLVMPIPAAWSFQLAGEAGKKQLTLMIDRHTAKPSRSVFGYVAFMQEAPLQVGTASPLCAQIAIKLPFRYGNAPWETEDGYKYTVIFSVHIVYCVLASYT